MGTLLLFTVAILLTFIHQAESSSVFVQKGQDVRLDVQGNIQLKELEVFKWSFRSANIVRCSNTLVKVSSEYNNRVGFYKGNFSMILKNLQEGDSGSYTAVVTGDSDTIMAEHLLEVQERVEPPVLTVNSVSSIHGTCNVTVTCRGQNTSVTSSCNSSTCSQVGGESRGAETSHVPLLSVYVAGGCIICNHSNQVSWVNDTKEIMELCQMKSDQAEMVNSNYALPVVIAVCVVGFCGIAVLIWYVRQKAPKRGKDEIINTDHASVVTPDNGQACGVEQVSPAPGPTSIYSVLGNHQPPPVNLPMTPTTSMPESLYSVVGQKTSKQ